MANNVRSCDTQAVKNVNRQCVYRWLNIVLSLCNTKYTYEIYLVLLICCVVTGRLGRLMDIDLLCSVFIVN